MIFGFALTPHFFLHELMGHEDTHCHPGTKVTVEPFHQHCKILQLELQVYTTPSYIIHACDYFDYETLRVPAAPMKVALIVSCFYLRGPPRFS